MSDTIPKPEEKTEEKTSILPLFELVSWSPCAYWSIKGIDESCELCRNNVVDLCVDCVNNELNYTKRDDKQTCIITHGTCGHGFHKHCIDKWLTSHNKCPIDNKQWVSRV